MKTASKAKYLAMMIALVAFLIGQGTVRGQAPPGPLPQAESKDTAAPASKAQPSKPGDKAEDVDYGRLETGPG